MDSLNMIVEPWGQIKVQRMDIEKAGRSKAEGGSGIGEEFWKWCEDQGNSYL